MQPTITRCVLFSNCSIKKLKQRGAQRLLAGFSLLETAIVLGVMAVVLGGLWNLLNNVQENYRQDQTVSQVAQVVSNVRDVYKSMGAIENGDQTSYLIGKNAILSEMIRHRTSSPYTAGHLWDGAPSGGSFKIFGGDKTGVSSAAARAAFFTIQFSSLNKKTCLGLASKLTGEGGPVGLISSKVNSSVKTEPISPEDAVGLCNRDTTNELALTYRLRQQ